jgi:hypothetical protein
MHCFHLPFHQHSQPWVIDNDVLYLQPNTAAQTIRLSLNEGRIFVDTYTHYLIEFEKKDTQEKFYFVADVDSETDRITTITVGTDDDDGANSSILLTDPGEYIYTVYAQNSASNLSPVHASVVGVVEYGQLKVWGDFDYDTESTATVPTGDVIVDE